MMNFKEGEILYIDKPYRMSSFGALAHIRYLLTKKMGYKVKVGHAGTLDPLATGVLILCTGRATKRIEELQKHTKEYVATLQLGATTASYDMEHPVDANYPTDQITRDRLEDVLLKFIGDIEQVPPAYSACNVNGKRAYTLMRKGHEVELKAKPVRIDEIELMEFDIYPFARTRHRGVSRQWGLSHIPAPNTSRRGYDRQMPDVRHVQFVA